MFNRSNKCLKFTPEISIHKTLLQKWAKNKHGLSNTDTLTPANVNFYFSCNIE